MNRIQKLFFFGGLGLLVVGLVIFFISRPPEGVETMSPSESVAIWLGVGSSVLGMVSSVVALIVSIRDR